jgi:hypothetical protein
MMVVFTSYTAWSTHKRRQHIDSWWRRNGPLLLAIIAAVLIVLEPIRHVVMDNTSGVISGVDFGWLLREYRHDCDAENPSCFALGGWLFTFGTTYVGFACLMASTLWLIDARHKIRSLRMRWREIRKGR